MRAIKELGVEPGKALSFEDSLNGLQAAKATGLYCVVVPNSVTAHLPFKHHNLRISSMKEMSLNEVLKKVGCEEK